MQTARRPRAAIATLLAILVVGGGAAYAARHGSTSRSAGTGVVVIETNLGYRGGAAAGTGMVLTRSGEVLTNNHVIAGATTIRVVVAGSTRSYSARVVGYDTTADVAVLQLRGASNLATVKIGDASKLDVGDHVTAVGNARGTGSLASASGTVTGLNRAITAQDDNGGAERLTGLIQTSAALQPGDSGGPLLVGDGRVVGMDTALATDAGDGYAVPIGRAMTIADAIEAGRSSATVHVGDTAFLGVELEGGPGATIAGLVSHGPAAAAGLVPGDTITAVGGRAVSGPDGVQSAVQALPPGGRVTVAYVDASGVSRTVEVTLGSGPPQ